MNQTHPSSTDKRKNKKNMYRKVFVIQNSRNIMYKINIYLLFTILPEFQS